MTNAELIKALRYCAEHEECDYYIAKDCPRESTWMYGVDCAQELMLDAADALEAAEKRIAELEDARKDGKELWNEAWKALQEKDKRIAELEAQIPKEGEWLRTDAFPHRIYCSVCYKTYVPNDRWQIWVDDELPKNYCPNCGVRMRKGELL